MDCRHSGFLFPVFIFACVSFCIGLPYFVKIEQPSTELWRHVDFFKMAAGSHIGFHRDDIRRERLIIAHVEYHTDQSRAHAYIYWGTLFHFLSFSSFVDCRARVRVSSRVRDSVSFIFIAFFLLRCMLKDRKLQPPQVPPQWYSGYSGRTVLIE